jgi:hypothetical protein
MLIDVCKDLVPSSSTSSSLLGLLDTQDKGNTIL